MNRNLHQHEIFIVFLLKQVIASIMDVQCTMLGDIVVPKSTQKVCLKRKVSLAELNRFRKQFLKLACSNPEKLGQTIGDAFVIYLNANLF